jgi:hypothetical protein
MPRRSSKIPRLREYDRRDVGMMLRISPAEHKLFLRCARRNGLSLSGWARMLLLESVRRENMRRGEG